MASCLLSSQLLYSSETGRTGLIAFIVGILIIVPMSVPFVKNRMSFEWRKGECKYSTDLNVIDLRSRTSTNTQLHPLITPSGYIGLHYLFFVWVICLMRHGKSAKKSTISNHCDFTHCSHNPF